MMRRWVVCLQIIVFVTSPAMNGRGQSGTAADESVRTDSDSVLDARVEKINAELNASLREKLKALPAISDQEQGAVDQYSRRGDLEFFLGEYEKAEADYQQMVRLQPDLDASHWRLGIAMYFSGHPEQAAAQFDKYHSFDNVDRENGIWRYLSHRMAFGKEKARGQLLKYDKDDRPPFKEVYRLFDGSLSEDQVLQSVSPDLPETTRNSRLFYAHLYVGLYCSADGRNDRALKSLRHAVLNSWPQESGYGPNFMWHVGRLQYFRLKAATAADDSPKERK